MRSGPEPAVKPHQTRQDQMSHNRPEEDEGNQTRPDQTIHTGLDHRNQIRLSQLDQIVDWMGPQRTRWNRLEENGSELTKLNQD